MAGRANPVRKPLLMVGLSASGLLNPLLVLAGELARRGVPDLLLATDDDRRAEVEALAAETKVEFVPLGDMIPEFDAVNWDDETYRAVTQRSRFKAFASVMRHNFRPEITMGKYRLLEAAVAEHQPALMVIDVMSGWAVDLAITKGIPYVLSVPFQPSNVLSATAPFGKSYTPPSFPTPRSGLPYPMSLAHQIQNRLFRIRTLALFVNPKMSARLKEGARVRAELGISPETQKPLARIENAERVLCYTVPELDYPFDIPDKVRTVGAMVPPLPQAEDGGELAEWLDAQDSVIYQGFGTITRLTRDEVAALVEVARRLQDRHQVLWKLPREQQHLLPDELPPNLRIEDWVPSQLDVLAHPSVKLFFNHAGGNAYNESARFGKPQVLRPLWVDCYDQAVRARDLGVGLQLDRPDTIDPEDVLDKLQRVLEDASFTERAERIAELHRAAGGRTAAADLILALPALTPSTR